MPQRRSKRSASDVVASATESRVPSVDALRGLAIVAMIAYHFAFDLRYFGVIRADFENDPFWLNARTAIVASFLALVGVSLVLAERDGLAWPRFLRRVAVIAACALAASAASWLLFPRTFIYFGVLHCIAVSLLAARPLARRPLVAVALGIAIVVAGLTLSHPVFDARALSWIGFTTTKPQTQDYVPLFPWLGVVLFGIGLGHALMKARFRPIAWLAGAPRALRWLGRHSLATYMVHQPILMGLIRLALAIARA
jgi:uncharacterized membrane protein